MIAKTPDDWDKQSCFGFAVLPWAGKTCSPTAVLVLPFCPGPAKPAPLQLFWFCCFALGQQNLLPYSCFGFAVLPWAGKACSPTAVLVLPFCPGPAKLASPGFASPGQNGKTKTAVACRRAGFAGPGQNGKTKTAVGEQALPAQGKTAKPKQPHGELVLPAQGKTAKPKPKQCAP